MDWLFERDRRICHVRVTGVLLREGYVLAQRSGGEYALPGGHLRFGETTEEALIREYREETGAEIVCERLLWTEEHFWNWGDRPAHNLGFYYLIHLVNDQAIPSGFRPMGDNPGVEIGWVAIDELPKLCIYPTFLPEEIHRLGEAPKHFIRHESF